MADTRRQYAVFTVKKTHQTRLMGFLIKVLVHKSSYKSVISRFLLQLHRRRF